MVDAIVTMSISISRIDGSSADQTLQQLQAMLHRVRVIAADAPAMSLSPEDRTDLSRQAQRLAAEAADVAAKAPLQGLSALEGGYVVLEMTGGSDVSDLLARIEHAHAKLVAAQSQQAA